MDCPSCKYPDTRVIESRPDKNDTIRRRRQCMRCGYRMTTHEKMREPKQKGKSHVIVT